MPWSEIARRQGRGLRRSASRRRRIWPPWQAVRLSQGDWDGRFPGSPVLPDTGALVKVNRDGTFTVIIDGLDRPTSLEFIGKTAYVVTLDGEIWKIDNVSR